jgi:hypothetical protein
MNYTIPIPLLLLNTLKASFEKEGKKMCTDIAKTLGLPPQDVIKKVFGKMNLEVIDYDKPSRCRILQKNEDEEVYRWCSMPCILGTERCINHQTEKMANPQIKLPLQRIETENEILWLNENTVYNSNGEEIGFLRDGELYLVEFKD